MIALESIALRAGAFALQDVSLEVPAGEYAVLMGRTGSGKTCLVECICGLRAPTAGRVWLDGVDVTRARPAERGVGYVPQDGALFPTMTVAEQLAFPLLLRRRPRAAVRGRVLELAELLALGPLLGRRPRGLSGGERQRVALGRALAAEPRVLCLDEPLAALDEETREDVAGALAAARAHAHATVLHVTHSRAEAARLADRVFVLEGGRLRAVAVPGRGEPS